MATPTYSTGVSANTVPIPTAIAATMLIPPTPSLISSTLAMNNQIERGQGIGKMFVGVDNFPLLQPTNVSATQGPAPISPTYFSVTVTAAVYSQAVIIPTTTVISSQIPWVAVIVNRQQVASKRTEDYIIAQSLLSSANIYNCVYGTNGQVPSEMTYLDAATLVAIQRNNNAPNSAKGMKPSVLYNTYGFTSGWLMLTSTIATTVFTTQGSQNFTQYSATSQPEDALPSEIGYFPVGIRVLASSQWPGTGTITAAGYPQVQGSLVSVASYTRLVHPEMYHRTNIVGSAYLGLNNLQEGTSTQWWGGAAILQPTWVRTVLYTGISTVAA